jgi:ABC-type uncharacterized transport system permease subunit
LLFVLLYFFAVFLLAIQKFSPFSRFHRSVNCSPALSHFSYSTFNYPTFSYSTFVILQFFAIRLFDVLFVDVRSHNPARCILNAIPSNCCNYLH